MPSSTPHIVQVSPISYSGDGIVGGGERIALYIDEALRIAATHHAISLTTTLLALDGRDASGGGKDRFQRMCGFPWDPHSVDADELAARLRPGDAVYVHQCLTPIGLFAAAHARLLGKRVFGLDSGAGEAPILHHNPDAIAVYGAVHAQSSFAASSFAGLPVAVHIVPGPVDTELHRPAQNAVRDRKRVVSVGRILPHKGHERTIRALPRDMSLTIVGQHYDHEYLSFLHHCAAGKDVTFADGLSDAEVRALLASAGVFVHASTHVDYLGRYFHKPELLGLAPLEALACGAPTLVSDAGSLPELAVVPGCRVFRDEAELTALLLGSVSGELGGASGEAMHAAVEARFGLATVGSGLLRMMGFVNPCAS